MKKRILFIAALVSGMMLSACDDDNSTPSNSINSGSPTSISASTSTSVSAPSTSTSAKPSLPSLPPSASSTPTDITSEQAISLILNAGDKDVSNAKTSQTSLKAIGYDNGRRYEQNQETTATSYQNNITIESGNVEQFYYDNKDVKYTDTFDEVRTIEDSNYLRVREYKSHVFQDESERINLLLIDVTQISEALAYYATVVSCGAGNTSYEQFASAVQLGAEFGYAAQQREDGLWVYFKGDYESSAEQNQKCIFEFYFLFDSLNNGFLTTYYSEQRFYSLDKYLAAEDPSALDPTYFASTDIVVDKGELEVFNGELPVDIHASFVQEIQLTAVKTTLVVGETTALKSKVLPETAINKDLSFESSVPGIANVDNDGRITAISKGTCTITATNIDSGVSASIEITVIDKPLIDTGDDSKKGDLQEALTKALYQVFNFEIGLEYSSAAFDNSTDEYGNCKINSSKLSALSISEFAYDENMRKATFALADKEKLVEILPYNDNGNDLLSNRYWSNGTSSIYRNVIISFEIYLSSANEISYILVETRNDYAPRNDKVFAELTTENIETELSFEVNHYGTMKTRFSSRGFATPDEE